jgi:hypothetical protein
LVGGAHRVSSGLRPSSTRSPHPHEATEERHQQRSPILLGAGFSPAEPGPNRAGRRSREAIASHDVRAIWLSQLKLLQPGKAISCKLWLGAFSLALTRHPSAPERKKGQRPYKPVAGNRHAKRRITIIITTRREQRKGKEHGERKRGKEQKKTLA